MNSFLELCFVLFVTIQVCSSQFAPTFFQPAGYQFSNVNCIPNQPVGTISAYSNSVGNIAYTADPGTGSAVTVNSYSGQISMGSTASSGIVQFTFRATNQYGSSTVPVTIYCTNTGTGINTGGPTFLQPTYTFTVTSCSTGYYSTNAINVGAVYANGASYYTLSAGNGNNPSVTFSINPSGLITMNGYASAGYYTLTVTAYGTNGLTSSTTVTVYLSCNGNTNPNYPVSGNPVFQQSSYSFVICSPYFYKGEYYYCMNGPDELHMCWSVAEGLGLPLDFLRFCGSIPFLVNDIGLTLAETYLLAAVTIFAPSVLSNVSNKALVAAHYDFYMDALFYQLGNRLSIADRAITSVKLEKVIQMFPLIDKISMGYFQNLDLSHVPVRSREVIIENLNFAGDLYRIAKMLCTRFTAITAFLSIVRFTLIFSHEVRRIAKRQIFPYPYGITYPYSTSILPYGAGTFSQPAYTFTLVTCTPGSIVGTVYATGATGYSITSGSLGMFSVSQSGQITVGPSQLASGTYQINISTYGSTLATTAVTIFATCTGYNYGIAGNTVNTVYNYGTGAPVFYQPLYSFTLTTCTQGQTLVGNVGASNAVSYSIQNGNGQFTVDNLGNLYTSGMTAYNPGMVTFNVVATGSSGTQAVAPVSVNVNCLNALLYG
ncbi:uncharacterized protein LOC129588272 [Paramacrobiotus metropolitanus]|uniref:uncharacterized protein LOC129588272 n=1 Tax=Paramacrobiotus metropolitanus TaxID=2943436 RepID=UPI0024457EE0|nr:uncharacterized protein LOC129588272 [Paramacrobiotus metropolitanus]